MSKPILEEKDILNPNEAIELFVLSRRKFYKLLKENRKLGFLAMYGSRKLIIRSEFQKYLEALLCLEYLVSSPLNRQARKERK